MIGEIQHAGDDLAAECAHAEPGRARCSRPRRVPVPDRRKGVSFTDVRDIAEVAVLEIQRRLAAEEPLGSEIYEVVAEDVLTGDTGAELWVRCLAGRSRTSATISTNGSRACGPTPPTGWPMTSST